MSASINRMVARRSRRSSLRASQQAVTRKLVLEVLEDRRLMAVGVSGNSPQWLRQFVADSLAQSAVVSRSAPAGVRFDSTTANSSAPLAVGSSAQRHEIVFIDGAVADQDSLLRGLRDGVEVVPLRSGTDGVAQIAAYLDQRVGIDAIHIVSHGFAGEAILGTAELNNSTLAGYADKLAKIGASLTENGDILLYGCGVAAGSEGSVLVSRLAQLMRADVAASTDTTGAASLGGDWILEKNVGSVETTLFSSSLSAYGYALAAPVLSLGATTVTVAENAAASTLVPSATVTDDTPDWFGGQIVVNGVATGDTISISTTTTNTTGAIRRNGSNLELGNGSTWAVIGTMSGGVGASLRIAFSSASVTPAVGQNVLRALTFLNNSDNPVTSRTLAFAVSDGDGGTSNVASLTVAVTAVNDRPAISNAASGITVYASAGNTSVPSGVVGFLLNDLFVSGRITDPDGTTNDNLGIAVTSVANANDIAGFYYTTNGGTNWIEITKNNVNTTTAVLLANSSSTRLYVRSKANSGATIAGFFGFRAWDKSNGTAASGTTLQTTDISSYDTVPSSSALSLDTTSVSVTFGVGNPPTVTVPSSYSGTEDTAKTLPGISITDGDQGASVSMTLKFSVPSGSGSFSATDSGGVTVTGSGTSSVVLTGTLTNLNTYVGNSGTLLSFLPAANLNGTVIINALVTDSTSLTASANSSLTLAAVNDPPVVDLNGLGTGYDNLTNFTEGSSGVAIAPSTTLTDVDSSNLSSLTATLTSRPDGNAVESLTLNSTAQTAYNGIGGTKSWSYTPSTGVLTVSGTASLATYETIVRGIVFNDTSTNPTTSPRTVTVVLADDSLGSSTARAATLTLVNVNNPPTVTPLADRTATAGLPFSFSISGSFSDPEGGALTYRATLTNGTALPGWLTFDKTTLKFYGAAPSTGTFSVRVTAADPAGNSTYDDFDIVVSSTLSGQSVAYVSFPKVYSLVDAAAHSSSGYYQEETNDFTTASSSIVGTNFVFYQAGVTRFSGNNVPGVLTYIDASGNVQSITGIVSRPIKSPGNTVEGYYMWVDNGTTSNVTDDTAYLLVVNENYFTGSSVYNSSSDQVDAALNGYLDAAVISITGASANEGTSSDGSITFTVTRSSGTSAGSVTYATSIGSNDTASAGDFVATSGILSFAVGETSKTFTVTLNKDSVYESDETFTASLSSPSTGSRIGSGVATGTIVNDDSAAVFSIASAGTVEGGLITFVVTRTGSATTNQSVSFITAIGGTDSASVDDFTVTQGTLTFGPNDTTKTFTVQTTDDAVLEDTETFSVQLVSPTNGTTVSATNGTATGYIENDEGVVLYSIINASIAEGGNVAFTVKRSGDVQQSQTIQYETSIGASDTATSGDFTGVSAPLPTLTFSQGQLTKAVEIQTTADSLYEFDETFTITLKNLSSVSSGELTQISTYGANATGTITNDDPIPSFSIAAASNTEGSAITFTVTRTGDAQSSQTVRYNTSISASDTASLLDFTQTGGVLTFAQGETTKTFTVSTTADALLEGNETFTVALSDPTGGAIVSLTNGSAIGTIVDDDGRFTEDGSAITLVPSAPLPSDATTYTKVSVQFSDSTIKDGAYELLQVNSGGSPVCSIPLNSSDGTTGSFQLSGVTYSYLVTRLNGETYIAFSLNGGGTLSASQANALLTALQYQNTDQDPDGSTERALSLTATTSTDTITVAAVRLTVVPVNDAPVLDLNTSTAGNNHAATFSTSGTAVAFSSGSTNLSDVDSTTFDQLAISYTTANFPDGASERLLINGATSGGTIAGLGSLSNGATGSVVLSGVTYSYSVSVSGGVTTLVFTGASQAELTQSQAEALIDALRYENTASSPTNGSSRVFSVTPTDGAALSATSASTFTVTVDTVLPTIIVSSSKSSLKAGDTATITFTLSEASTDFVLGDITVTGGTLDSWTAVSGTDYTARFTPTASSTANGVISVASGKFSDAAGNLNADGADTNNTVTMSVDTVLPTIIVSSDKSSLKAGEQATITFTLSEESSTFLSSSITVTGGTLGTLARSNADHKVYTATFTPTASSTADGAISVASGKFSDAAGNFNADGADTNNTVTMLVDTRRPGIVITSDTSVFNAGETATITFTLSEASSDFTFADITVSGGTLGALTQSGTDPRVYTATFTPTAQSTSDCVISVGSDAFSNLAGNFNADGADTDNSLTLENAAVAVDDSSANNDSRKPVTVNVLANDRSKSGRALDPSSVKIVGTANPGDSLTVTGKGTWSVNGSTGAITFTPVDGYTGDPPAIQYTVKHSNGGRSNAATVDIKYKPIPKAMADAKGAQRAGAVKFSVLDNDTDDNGGLDPKTVDLDPTTSGRQSTRVVANQGTWSVDDLGNVTFTPNAGYSKDPSPITYTVQDIAGQLSDAATISLDYVPVATNDSSANNPAGQPVAVSVLTNDTTGDTPESGTVKIAGPTGSVTSLGVRGQGTWTVNSGTITFTPTSGFTGDPTAIRYTVNDSHANVSNFGMVTIGYTKTCASHAFTLVLDNPSTVGYDVIVVDDAPVGTSTAWGSSNAADQYNTTKGYIFYSGAVGSFTTNRVGAKSKPVVGTSNEADISISSTHISNAAGTIVIWATDTCYDLTVGAKTFTSPTGGSTNGTMTFQETVDLSNRPFATAGLSNTYTNNLGPYSAGAFSGTKTTGFTLPSGTPVSLTKKITLTHPAGSKLSMITAGGTIASVSDGAKLESAGSARLIDCAMASLGRNNLSPPLVVRRISQVVQGSSEGLPVREREDDVRARAKIDNAHRISQSVSRIADLGKNPTTVNIGSVDVLMSSLGADEKES